MILIDNTDEIRFMLKLDKELNDDLFKIVRTSKENSYLYDPFCCVDYVILYNDKVVCYIELKSRKQSLKLFYGLLIGSTKIYNIDKLKKPTFIIWEDLINDNIYWTTYKEEFKLLKDILINNSYCKKIMPNELNKTLTDLIVNIRLLIKPHNIRAS
jgi:hypothetical protein